VFGQAPFENPDVTPKVAMLYDKNEEASPLKVKEAFTMAAEFRPNWDGAYAADLAGRFELPLKKRLSTLSHGQRSAVHAVIGLAGRTPVTLYDEVTLGMDAANRKVFTSEVLEDYMRFPRTILFSTHYISEVERLFSEVLILDKGRVLLHEDSEELRDSGIAVTGEAKEVDAFVRSRRVLSERTLGPVKEAVAYGKLTGKERADATAAGLAISSPSIEDLFIFLTQKDGEEKGQPAR
jgi:ABC-2 type transport system ATP-binding protein